MTIVNDSAVLVAVRKAECELDGLYFARYFMKQRLGSKMIIGRHHPLIQQVLDRTMLPPGHPDFISRLIITVPPGYTKTELAAISYIARGLAINPRARFLHLSYSHALALLNSSTAREIVKSGNYQTMWPIQTKDDADSKSMWWTVSGGGVYATATGGQVTGFRAGHMDHSETGFSGALIIDDPVKPDDANSEVMRDKVNNRYNETISSRVAVETVPIIVIMQRIHHKDLAGYLLTGGSGEYWHHLDLPVIIKNEPYPKEYTHGIPIEHHLEPGWLWPFKHNEQHEKALSAHRRKFQAQYLQRPIKRDESIALWTEKTINATKIDVPDISGAIRTIVAIDPATTNTLDSDEHGIGVASQFSKTSYTVDADYTRKGSPKDWAGTAIQAYETHNADAIVIETNQGGDMCEDTLRNAGFRGRIIRVHASKGKTARAEPVAALYEMGYVKHRSGLLLLEDEMLDLDPLTGKVEGRSPNRVDWVVWALSELANIGDNFGELLRLATTGQR